MWFNIYERRNNGTDAFRCVNGEAAYQHDELAGAGRLGIDPYGSLMKENIKQAFINRFNRGRDDSFV